MHEHPETGSGPTVGSPGPRAGEPADGQPAADGPAANGPAEDRSGRRVRLSVVAPAHNEEDNLAILADEIRAALDPLGIVYEFVLVDDGSTDRTRAIALELAADRPWMRVLAMTRTPPGRGNGQSAAFHAGFRAARGELIAVLDADLQNDPADIPKMLELIDGPRPSGAAGGGSAGAGSGGETGGDSGAGSAGGADFVQGDRSHARQDNWVKRRASWVGRLFRRLLLGDTIRDTGCSLRVMRREIALALPLEFKGMHRFIPVTARDLGYRVVEMPVNHRSRHAGETKYGKFGITQRAIPGLIDCFAVRWMRGRRRPVAGEAVEPGGPAASAVPGVGGGESTAAVSAGGAVGRGAGHASGHGRGSGGHGRGPGGGGA